MYLIRDGIWRGYYLKDGNDSTLWFASVGEVAFSIWGYADNSASQISIEACKDSIAYCISRQTLTKLFDSSLGLADLGHRLMEQHIASYLWITPQSLSRIKAKIR